MGPAELREIALMGEYIMIARKRRGMSLRDFDARMMVSVPTVMNLEKGSPVVGIGILIRALSVLGLEKNFAAIAAPERDEAGMALEMRRLKSIGARNPMAETDLDF